MIATGSRFVLGMRVDNTSYAAAAKSVLTWAAAGASKYVCCANVHMVMESFDDPQYMDLVNRADLVTPDGMPLVWALRGLAAPSPSRVYGPNLTKRVLAEAAAAGVLVGFYGGTEETLQLLLDVCRAKHPQLKIAFAFPPPFRELTVEEDVWITDSIHRSGCQVLFVGLGCPKQERWMAARKGRVNVVMLGVGAAFDFLAGVKPAAPSLLQAAGLEWLFRLATEPRRLWRRYCKNNPRFLVQFCGQYFRERRWAR